MRIRSLASITLLAAGVGAGCNPSRVTSPAQPTPSDTAPTPTPTGTNTLTTCSSSVGTVTASGGTVDCLVFGVVGDTRPATKDDTAGYPTAIITKIYQDLEAETVKPAFAVATGDYVYASKTGTQGPAQLDLYLNAQSNFSHHVFHALGNHECTGYTDSNCGSGNTDGLTGTYSSFLSKMALSKPYYSFRVDATDGSWTCKFVVIAANAWDSTQATWLANAMSDPTTYTFVVRHEGIYSNTAPGVTPSQNIITQHPYTMLIEGHTHDLQYWPNDRELITGNGGAPLTGSTSYGYVIVKLRSDGAVVFDAWDYQTHAAMKHFVVTKNGAPTS